MKTTIFILMFVLLLGCLCGCGEKAEMVKAETNFLIDDFKTLDGVSAAGSKWVQYTDQVMGGVSTAKYSFENLDGRNCLRLTGDVSLENNGGFVMMSLDIKKGGSKFDATNYQGVRVKTKGNGEDYYVQIRTTENWFPWQFYYAKFPTSSTWQVVDIPFSDFQPENSDKQLNLKKLKKVAIFAYKKKMQADVAVSSVEFYTVD